MHNHKIGKRNEREDMRNNKSLLKNYFDTVSMKVLIALSSSAVVWLMKAFVRALSNIMR